jgi:hypothetical protein
MPKTAQKCLLLVAKATLQVSNLLTDSTILQVCNLLMDSTILLGEVLDHLGITSKTAPLLRNDALSVMLQLEQMLGISGHVHPTTVVVNLKDIAHLIHVSLPL